MTKHLLRNSCGLQAVLCIKKSVICSSRYAYTNLIILRANFGCKTYQRLVFEQRIQSGYFFFKLVHLLSKQRYHPPCSTRSFFHGHKITHSCMIFVFDGTIHPPKSHTICFLLAHCQNPCHDFPFSLKKRREKKKRKLHLLDISMIVYLQRPLQFQLKLTSSR